MHVGDVNGLKTCVDCDPSCATCDCQAEYCDCDFESCCSSCPTGKVLFMFDCYDSCPDGSFLPGGQGDECFHCATHCTECTNTASECTACPIDFKLIDDMCCLAHAFLLIDHISTYPCVDNCPEGYFADDDDICQPCLAPCENCMGAEDFCTSCVPGMNF